MYAYEAEEATPKCTTRTSVLVSGKGPVEVSARRRTEGWDELDDLSGVEPYPALELIHHGTIGGCCDGPWLDAFASELAGDDGAVGKLGSRNGADL